MVNKQELIFVSGTFKAILVIHERRVLHTRSTLTSYVPLPTLFFFSFFSFLISLLLILIIFLFLIRIAYCSNKKEIQCGVTMFLRC